MDAYHAFPDTTTACFPVMGNSQPWDVISSTQTVLWRRAPIGPRVARNASFHQQHPDTFYIIDVPQIEGLDRLRTFRAWRENWDGEGGKAPDNQTLDAATAVFGILSVLRVPQVTLSAEGHPMFIYGAPLNGEVVVTSPTTIDYFFADDNSPEGEDIKFDGYRIPQDLLDYVRVA